MMARKIFIYFIILILTSYCSKKSPDDVLKSVFENPQNVIELNLGLTELKEIPKKISLLKNLQILDVRLASLKELPEEIGDLKKLKVLILYGNRLKSLPPSFKNLQNLETFLAGKNQFSQIPILLSSLNKLENLHLEKTLISLSEKDINTLSQISNLKILELSENPNIKLIPENIYLLKGLKKLIIKKSKLPVNEKKKLVETLKGTEIKF